MALPVSTNLGYDVNATKKNTPPGANGIFSYTFDGERQQKLLWVYEVQTGFALSGVIGQSFRTRSFFPRNFKQPSLRILCQFPNQQLYAEFIEFVRKTQRTLESSALIEIVSGTNYTGTRLKGASSNIAAEGYVKSVPRAHERFVYAPELSFEFIIERMITPERWADSRVKPRELLSWNDVVHNTGRTFAEDSDPVPTPPLITPGPNGQNRPN